MPLRMSSLWLLLHGTMWAASTTVWRKRGQTIFEKSSLSPFLQIPQAFQVWLIKSPELQAPIRGFHSSGVLLFSD
jgi:hypothetical protein